MPFKLCAAPPWTTVANRTTGTWMVFLDPVSLYSTVRHGQNFYPWSSLFGDMGSPSEPPAWPLCSGWDEGNITGYGVMLCCAMCVPPIDNIYVVNKSSLLVVKYTFTWFWFAVCMNLVWLGLHLVANYTFIPGVCNTPACSTKHFL